MRWPTRLKKSEDNNPKNTKQEYRALNGLNYGGRDELLIIQAIVIDDLIQPRADDHSASFIIFEPQTILGRLREQEIAERCTLSDHLF